MVQVLELSGIKIGEQAISLPIINVEQMEKPIAFHQQNLSQFLGLEEALLFITLKNSSEFSPSGNHEKGSVPIFKRVGRLNITAERFMNMIETFQPDFFSNLADGDTFKDCSKRRVSKACDRSEEMFQICLERKKSSESLKNSFFLACVEGGFNELERMKAVEHLKEHEAYIDGYLIDGFHRNADEATTLEAPVLLGIVDKVLAALPTEKLKMMLGAYSPLVLLKLISSGVDIFDTSFVDIVTKANRALVFNFDTEKPTKVFPEINLTDAEFKEDFTPFVDGCECYACKKHNRAYVNHLLQTHELLGDLLLSIHNTYHYLKFFEAIRSSIKNNRLAELTSLISDQYKDAESTLSYKTNESKEEVKENS